MTKKDAAAQAEWDSKIEKMRDELICCITSALDGYTEHSGSALDTEYVEASGWDLDPTTYTCTEEDLEWLADQMGLDVDDDRDELAELFDEAERSIRIHLAGTTLDALAQHDPATWADLEKAHRRASGAK